MCTACSKLLNAINAYIAKADKRLSEELENAGFADPENTVKHIDKLEEQIVEILKEQSKSFEELLEEAEKEGVSLEEFLEKNWKEFKNRDDIKEKLFPAFFNEYSEYVPALANIYIKQMDSELIVEQVTRKTTDWIAQWSYELSDLMHLSSHAEIENVLIKGLKSGKGVGDIARDIQANGIRDEYYKARRAALTETLRAHSFAREDSIQQCPAAEMKEWVHTGEYRNEPRPNHEAINGQIVGKDENFVLKGADGVTYYPIMPKDPALPAAEVINCHCIHRGIASENILGLSLEERKKLQQQAIEELESDPDRYAELDEELKNRAGINSETIKCDWLKNKTAAERKKYFRSDSRWALFESGVIQNDADLERLYKTVDTKYGQRKMFKTLTELKNDGIITVPDKTLRHSTVGDYVKPSKDYPNGRLKKGGHSQKCIDELINKGIDYKITKICDNGVRLGYVPEHKQRTKQSGIGQSWFPDNWSDDDIRNAGTYVANAVKSDDIIKFAEYNGIKVGVFIDDDGFPSTIFPDNSKQP